MTLVHPNLISAEIVNSISVGGRLTAVSNDPNPESDVVGATTIYLCPTINNISIVYNGTNWQLLTFSQISLSLHSTLLSDNNYDVWDFNSSGTLNIGTGPSWVNGAVSGDSYKRGTGAGSTELEVFNGRLVNKNQIILRNGANTFTILPRRASLRGTIRMTANGITEDSRAKRFISNLHNPELKPMTRAEPSTTWTYTSPVWRLANGSNLNRVQYVQCVSGRRTNCQITTLAYNSTSSLRNAAVGIGINVSNINHATRTLGGVVGSFFGTVSAYYEGYPGLGHRVFNWLEYGSGNDTLNWVGTFETGSPFFQTGMAAETLL